MDKKISKIIIWLTFILIGFGLIMLSSAGVYFSQKKFGQNYYYFNHQLIYGFIPGLILFLVFSKINYQIWKKISLVFLLFSFILLILVFLPNLGISYKGAKRWINLGFLSFQPSEILKLSLIIYLASWLNKTSKLKDATNLIIPFLIILFFIGFLLSAQPDIGTLGIITFIALSMIFVSGFKLKHFFLIFLIIIFVGFLIINLEHYRLVRILVFINPEYDPSGAGYHLNQSLIAFGSGGLFGSGFGKGEQKLGFLPESVGDSIFAIIGEELGFLGASLIIGLLLSLIIVIISLSKKIKNEFGRFYIIGIASWIGFQSFLNISSLIGLLPLTGVPLPFISFGGTSLAVLMAGMGILVNITKTKEVN